MRRRPPGSVENGAGNGFRSGVHSCQHGFPIGKSCSDSRDCCAMVNVNTAIPIEILRADAPAVLLGVLILFAGVMSCLLFGLRPRPRDSALLYFAIAASMYGLRLIATTRVARQAFFATGAEWDWIIWLVSHTIFIPFTFFFISTVAPQWRRAGPWIVVSHLSKIHLA